MKQIALLFFSFFFIFAIPTISNAQAPDFSLEDINGNQHNLYEDYLDQGKTVFIIFGAAWSPFDELWMETGVLQEFHNLYAESSDAVFLYIEADELTTIDDLYGNGPNSSSGYDLITGNPFPIINAPSNEIWEDFGIQWFPTTRLICPGGDMIMDGSPNSVPNDMEDERLFYSNLTSTDVIVDFMIDLCGTQFNVDQCNGVVYTDLDDNCENDDEQGIPYVTANISGPSGDFVRMSNDEGKFGFLAQEGDYTIEVVEPNALWSTCNNNQTISFSGQDETINIDFGMQSTEDCINPRATISSNFLRRCFESKIYVNYCNEGTIAAEGTTVEVNLDMYLEVVSTSVPADQNGQTLYFDVGTLDVWECGEIVITVIPDCDVELETEQCYTAEIYPGHPCSNSNYQSDVECQPIIGSYDPNDKRAFPLSGSDTYPVPTSSEPINYQIRFQNVGNDTAFTVVVDDVISSNLDLSTLRPGIGSHDYKVEILEDRLLRFTFENILLVDSTTNEIGSNGFINYTIAQIPNLQDGDEIINQGAIFFDFNDPVITNKTTHIIDNSVVNVLDNEREIKFTIAPNPADHFVDLYLNEGVGQKNEVTVIAMDGRILLKEIYDTDRIRINTSSYSSGIYYVVVKEATSGVSSAQRFSKM